MRMRHHTHDAGLRKIKVEGAIRASRAWGWIGSGIHVELEPFGTTRSFQPGLHSPKADLGLAENGAFVEFDAPPYLESVPYTCGPRNTAILITDRPLFLRDLTPLFVKVRRYWWQFWRTPPEL